MKTIFKLTTKLNKGLLLTIFALATFAANAQMSGNYTIDKDSAATATNFKNWNSFVKSLYNTSLVTNPRTDGGPLITGAATLSGPVVLKVMTSNTTAEAVALTFPVLTGASNTNTLTIDGNNKTYLHSATNAVFQFTGADWVTIKNLTIQSTATTPGGIWLNNQSDYNTFSGLTIYFSNLTSANTSVSYFSMSTSLTSPTSNGSAATGTTGQPGSYNMITGCKFYTQAGSPGPYYAVTMNGNSSNYTSVAQNNTFSNNVIENFNSVAIYMYYTNGNEVIDNDISRSNTTSGGQTTLTGINSYYPYGTSRPGKINGNFIHDLPFAGATIQTTNLTTIQGIYVYYPYGTSTDAFQVNGNTIKNVAYKTGSRYVFYIYYSLYSDITNNTVDNVDGTSTSSTSYDFYIYYPTAVRVNGNNCMNGSTEGYLYNYYCYYASVGTYQWCEFQDNRATDNVTENYMYSVYLYYNRGTTNWKANRNYIVGNKATASTGYFYFYLYYFHNYQVTGNVVAGNKANSSYIYLYAPLSGTYTAEVRNNTFRIDATSVPTPGSSYNYMYFYLYYHTVWFTGNIIDFKGPTSGTLAYYRYLYMYLSYSNPANLKEFNNNTYNLNNQFTYPYWYFNGTNYVDWSGFGTSGSQGSGDNGDDPLFIDPANGDWRAGAFSTQNNVPFNTITEYDAVGILRNTVRHDRGGLETPTDIAAESTSFSVPSIVCSGYTTGKTTLTVKSLYPYDKASNFNVSYSLNNGPKISVKVTKKLAFGDTAIATFPTPLVLNETGNARIAIFVDMPDDNTSNDSFIFTTFVKPAPGGGVLTPSAKPTQAYYQMIKANDVTVLGQPVIYNLTAPRVYNNADYGSKWTASVYSYTSNGTLRPSGETTMTPPTTGPGGKDMEIQFKSSANIIEDSTITVVAKITDLTNGCDTLILRNVLIYPTIVSDFSFPAKVCGGDAVLFENKSTVKSGTMEFFWDFGTGNPKDVAFQPEPVFTFPAVGTYKVKLLMKTLPYGFPTQDSAYVVVNEVPIVQFTKKDACEGYNLTFTNSTTPVNSTYLWKFGDNTTATTTHATHKYSKAGVYNVSLVATLNGCSATMTKRAYQFETPKTSWSKVSGNCDNVPFQFANTSSIANGSYGSLWDFQDGTVSTDASPMHEFQASGNLSVKLVTTSEFGCKDSLTKLISVKESPKVNFSNSNACSLTPTVFTDETPVVPGTIANYAWNFGDGGTSTAVNPTHPWGTLGPKTVTLKVSLDNLCFSSFSKTLTVGVQPKAEFSGNSVCAGEPVLFVNKTTWAQGDVSYEWNFGDGFKSTDQVPQKIYNTTQTKTYNVQLKAMIAGGCDDSVSHQITVNELPKACDFNANPDYAFSYYGMKFEVSPAPESGVTYTWVIENAGQKTGTSIQQDLAKDGVYSVTMVAKTGQGCECTVTKQVTMNRSQVAGLNEIGAAIYPNPTSGVINIALKSEFGKDVQVVMTNLAGAVVKSFNTVNNGLITFNANDLSSGMYVVKVVSGSNTATSKIDIQR